MVLEAREHVLHGTSHVRSNVGEPMDLAVEEYHDPSRPHPYEMPVVLMIHGRSVPARPVFALGGLPGQYRDPPDLSWALEFRTRHNWAAALADSADAFRVFVVDFQGNGLSSRPEMDRACNAGKADQPKLTPYPLTSAPCPGKYPTEYAPYSTGSWGSDWLELVQLLRWIKQYTGTSSIHLVGHSAGAYLAGIYAMNFASWPDLPAVNKLFLLSPIFPPLGLINDPEILAPLPGFPMNITTKTEFVNGWNNDVGHARELGMDDAVWDEILRNDPLGRHWGHEGGVMRWRNVVRWGWNHYTVRTNFQLGNSVPVCIVYGQSDSQVFAKTPQRPLPAYPAQDTPEAEWAGLVRNLPQAIGPPLSPKWLYKAINGENKLLITVPGWGHNPQWETQFNYVFRYCHQFLRWGGVLVDNPPFPIDKGSWLGDPAYGQLRPEPV